MRLGLLLSFGLIYSSVAADLNFIAGSGVTINATNKGNGNADLEFSMTPGVGAGDVTTLQLLTVSNLLWNINFATSNYFGSLPPGGGEVSTAQLLVVSNQMIVSSNALLAFAAGTTNDSILRTNSDSITPASGTFTVNGSLSAETFNVGTLNLTNGFQARGVTNETASKMAMFGADNRLTNSQYAQTDFALAGVTNSFSAPASIQKFATNVTWNVNMPLSGSLVAITNTIGGSTANLWLTNVVDGGCFIARILTDGTARTVSITNASALTLTVIATNGFSGIGTIPTVEITASKVSIICGRATVVAGVTNVDLWAAVQP